MRSSVCRLLLVVAIALATAAPVWAQALASPPGVVEGTGTHFEITDSEYLNTTLDSSEPVTVMLESVPRAVTLHIEAAEGAAAAQLTLSGFEPDTEYHLYQDDYHNHTPFTTDDSGSYTYLQDLASPHLVMIQPYPSTIFLNNSGWSQAGIGTWDPATKTGTLTTDVAETIQIDDSGITLDGHGHVSATTTLTRGVFVKGNVTGVTVRNLTIAGYTYGIDMGNNCSALTLSGNWISSCTKGISVFKCDHSIITGNTVSSCSTGIDIQTDRNAIGNTVYCNSFLGNGQQASVSGNGPAFQFSLPAPAGGNYWSDWTSPDNNHDGFVDNPYIFTGGQDGLPWTTLHGWDALAPTTTMSLSGTAGNNGWYTSAVTVALSATDNSGGSGVRTTESRLDGGPWTTYAAPFPITTDGSHVLYCRSTDNAGNVEGEHSQLVKVDKTPPAISAQAQPGPNGNGWNNTDVTVTFSATDVTSGVDTGSVTPPVTVTSEGAAQLVSGSARDLAGNAATARVTVSIDKTPPTISGAPTSPPNAAGWYNHNVIVHFTASDALSGPPSGTVDLTASSEGANQSVTGTATDRADNTASYTVSNLNIDKTPPVTAISLAGTGGGGWYRSDVMVTLTATDGLSGTASSEYQLDGGAWMPYTAPFSVAAEGTHSLLYRSTDNAGNAEAPKSEGGTVSIDKTPPATTVGLAGTMGNNGWYRSEVTVTLSAVDNAGGSGVGAREYALDGGAWTAYASPLSIASEGTHELRCRSTDQAGNVEAEQVRMVKIDWTPPTITGTRTPDANPYGWNNTDVTVHFTASDEVSGLDGPVPADIVLSAEGSGQSVTREVSDLAGNSASATVHDINIDKTAPAIEGSRTPEANPSGWNNTDVTVKFTGADALSGMASLTPDTTLTSEGAGQSLEGTATDKAGNSASFTVSGINIDKTPPTITGTKDPSPNSEGWNNTDVTVHFAASDSLSGVDPAGVPADVAFSAEGADQSVTRTVADRAGNSASVTVSDINIDKTPPTISGAPTTSSNANGWYKNDVAVHFIGSDSLSGVLTLTPDQIVSTEGADQSVEGSAVDKAGNSATFTVSGINLDKTPPTIAAARSPLANSYGWNNTDVTVHFVASDELSGLDGPVPADIVLSAEGGGQSAGASITDLAGNTASAEIHDINIDKTPPTLTKAEAAMPPNAHGWYNQDVTVTFTGADALSGMGQESTSTTLSTEGAGQSATGILTDKAGNSATFALSGINIDKTPPTIAAARSPLANSYGWNNTDVTVHFTASDGLSGLDGPVPADIVLSAEGSGQSAGASVTDLAGNTASAGMHDINIDKAPPTITGGRTPDANSEGWNNTDVSVHFAGADALSGLASLTPDQTVSTEGANQSVTGTATDQAGNAASYTVSGISIDKTPPVITVTIPASGGTYYLRGAATVDWGATDTVSGIDTATGTTPKGGALDTTTPGDHSFQVSAFDCAGNRAEKLVVYHVHYVYSGVLPPVNVDGKSIFKFGSTVPVKVQLRDANGACVANATVTLCVAKLSNGIFGDEVEAVSTAASTTGNLFRCDAGGNQYIFNLSTKPLSVGTWQMRIASDDGSSDVVLFSLR
jgi:parallel beta-helix repeat protein